jgi:hypothetical protein
VGGVGVASSPATRARCTVRLVDTDGTVLRASRWRRGAQQAEARGPSRHARDRQLHQGEGREAARPAVRARVRDGLVVACSATST